MNLSVRAFPLVKQRRRCLQQPGPDIPLRHAVDSILELYRGVVSELPTCLRSIELTMIGEKAYAATVQWRFNTQRNTKLLTQPARGIKRPVGDMHPWGCDSHRCG